jgi:hypothetical protein
MLDDVIVAGMTSQHCAAQESACCVVKAVLVALVASYSSARLPGQRLQP